MTISDIRSWHPCYDPIRYLPEDWTGNIEDIFAMQQVPIELRVLCGLKVLDERRQRLFVVRCARRTLSRIENPDPRSLNACDVAERYANGEATDEELGAASDAAWAARAAALAAANAASVVAYAPRAAAWAAVSMGLGDAERETQREDLIELLNLTLKP